MCCLILKGIANNIGCRGLSQRFPFFVATHWPSTCYLCNTMDQCHPAHQKCNHKLLLFFIGTVEECVSGGNLDSCQMFFD